MTKNLSGKLQPHLRTKSVNKTSHHAVSVTQFPAKQPLPAVSIHKLRHEGSQNVSTKNSSNNIFLLFSGSSSASKYQYQFNDMLSVINAEFTCTKHSSDTMYSPTTKSLSKTSTILLDSSSSSRIVVRDPLY